MSRSEGTIGMAGNDPEYRPVVFRDRAAGCAFLTRSTAQSDQTIEWTDGNTYPVVDVDISSASHPFWTGQRRQFDTAGRVEKFRAKYQRAGGPGRTPPAGRDDQAGD